MHLRLRLRFALPQAMCNYEEVTGSGRARAHTCHAYDFCYPHSLKEHWLATTQTARNRTVCINGETSSKRWCHKSRIDL
eukprot:5124064-Pyramimonas_sp.AAC.1